MTTSTEYLAALPEPIQDELARIARLAIGMSSAEKGAATGFFAMTGLKVALSPLTMENNEKVPGARMVTALAKILRAANDEAAVAAGQEH